MIKVSLDQKNLIIEFMVTELDHHIANEVRDEIDDILMSKSIKNIIFNFRNINFMDSSGIGVIIGRYKKISNDGGKVMVVNQMIELRKYLIYQG